MPVPLAVEHNPNDLLLAHEVRLRAYLLAMVRNVHDADDLYQEVCVAVLRDFNKLRSSDGFEPWSIQIAKNRIHEYFRLKRKSNARLAHLDAVTAAALHDSRPPDTSPSATDELIARLRICLATLNDRARRILELRYSSKPKSWDDIAKEFGQEAGALRTACSRTRIRLHKCIESQSNEVANHG
jgi:RNA polymerase sigma-70 factor (ECF subfamily)